MSGPLPCISIASWSIRSEHRGGRLEQAVPLGALHVHLHQQPAPGVTIAGDLVRERVEGTAVAVDLRRCRDALGMERHAPAFAAWRPPIEAVVLVDGHAQSCRDAAAPPVVARDAVGIASVGLEQVAAHQVAAVPWLSEALERAVGQAHRLQCRVQVFAQGLSARRRVAGDGGARRGRPRYLYRGRPRSDQGNERSGDGDRDDGDRRVARSEGGHQRVKTRRY